MKASTLIDVLIAAHYTHLVESSWKERGGLILVAPPGHLKTSLLLILREYPGVHIASDFNSQRLGTMRDDIISGRVHSVIVPDFQKLYERHSAVSSNLEGNLRALVEEGFINTAHQDTGGITFRARALVMSACTPAFHDFKYNAWSQTGFARRFLFVGYRLFDPNQLMAAIENWKRIEIRNGLQFSLPLEKIPYSLKRSEAKLLRSYLIVKQDFSTPFVLLQKIACVLRWRYRRLKQSDHALETLKDFSEGLGTREEAVVTL